VSRMELWAVILGGMLVTYVTRLSIVLIGSDRLPARLRAALRFVPPAVLSALIVPALVRPEGSLDFSFENTVLVAGILAGLVAWRTRNPWLTIASGLAARAALLLML